ncbi:WhiB family transcriptional regulator [Luteococcus peritonei]|uniref:WhiB family transcriptional regulator n=1 Tax=Luteococcus peritonei TaxID=88874 RepID=A0ABW4RWC2_9ACTN
MSIQTRPGAVAAQACIDLASAFQHPLLEEPGAPANARERHEQLMLQRKAERACLECPLLQRCLYRAVVEHDVAGYVAGTTPRQRAEIRARLGVRVAPEDLDSFTGAAASHRQIDPSDVLRMRTANPHESLETLANRLGCSLSTVKRHLRRARTEALEPREPMGQVRPSLEQVLHATRVVLGSPRRENRDSRAA